MIHNPVRFVRLTKERNERNRYLDPDQIKTLLGSANDCLRPIIFTALHWMRHDEIVRLRRKHLDLKNGTIYVPESKSGGGRHILISEIG